jgi:hypothetical protein
MWCFSLFERKREEEDKRERGRERRRERKRERGREGERGRERERERGREGEGERETKGLRCCCSLAFFVGEFGQISHKPRSLKMSSKETLRPK